MGYIYLITNTLTGKKYVGQTQRDDIEKRWKDHKSCDKYSIGRCLLNSYNKYGIDKFNFQIICICFDEDCDIYEEQYIKKFDTMAPNGYNLKGGGGHGRHHPDTIKLISEKNKGRKLPPRTAEALKHHSEARMGNKNHNFGKPITEDRRTKLSNAIKKIWEERKKNGTFDEYIKKIKDKSTSNTVFEKGRVSSNRKAVGRYDDKDNLLETYESTVEAGLKMGIHSSTIAKVCRGIKSYKKAAGFIWKFM